MATRTVALRMMPRRLRRIRLRETDSDSQYRRIGRKIVRTTVLGEGHLPLEGNECDHYSCGDEEHRGDEAKPVGNHVGDDGGTDECDDHFNGHKAAGLPSCAEGRGPTAAGSGRCAAYRGILRLPC